MYENTEKKTNIKINIYFLFFIDTVKTLYSDFIWIIFQILYCKKMVN